MLLLQDILRGTLDSLYLFGEIGFRVPARNSRARGVLLVPFARTTQAWRAPLVTMIIEYNALTEELPELEVFHGTEACFGGLVLEAIQG